MSACKNPGTCGHAHRKPLINDGLRVILAHERIGFNEDVRGAWNHDGFLLPITLVREISPIYLLYLDPLYSCQANHRLEAVYDHSGDRVAGCIEEVVRLITMEMGPVLSGEAPHAPDADETEDDAAFMAKERKIKLSAAIEVLQRVVAAPDWDTLEVALQKLVEFAADPTTTFLLQYDEDVKHPACCDADCNIAHA